MFKYEITKYNPIFRKKNENGMRTYERKDWTSIHDIGKVFNGEILTLEKYKEIEDSYINVLGFIIRFDDIQCMQIKDVRYGFSDLKTFEKSIKNFEPIYDADIMRVYKLALEVSEMDISDALSLCRLCLRENLGAKIFSDNKLQIFIGYDYLMSIHNFVPIDALFAVIERMGLFVEQFG